MQRSQELSDLYSKALRESSEGATVVPYFSTSPDVLVIGTGPDGWLTGADAAREIDKSGAEARAEGGEIIPSSPVAWEHGDVGWVVDRPMLRFSNGQEVPLRATCLFVREGSSWKAIHQHWSIGVLSQ